MRTATSKDGTSIAFDQFGSGPALVLVGGALEQRALDTATAQLAALPVLAEHFTVYHYDRRGRGASGDSPTYALQREIEDIAALIDDAGGSAYVFGISSGAALALEAALALGAQVQKLALYEVPYNDDAAARQAWVNYRKKLAALTADGRNGDAVILFMMLVGMPAEHAAGVRELPMWRMFEAVGHTLAYDAAALGEEAAVPTARVAALTTPVLVMDGSASFPFMHRSGVALAEALPHGRQLTLAGQTHEVAAEALAPVLIDFFNANADKRKEH
ncbi:MAG: alpha/beta fold hydrolase [Chloroflexia bacterium]